MILVFLVSNSEGDQRDLWLYQVGPYSRQIAVRVGVSLVQTFDVIPYGATECLTSLQALVLLQKENGVV